MQKKFDFLCIQLDEPIESEKIQLLFQDSWYWLHYRFFNCRDSLLSETSAAIRTHLYNLAAAIYKARELLPEKLRRTDKQIADILAEVIDIAEYAANFPLCVWVYGDETSKKFLDERLAGLPSGQQIERLMELPHMMRMESERLGYSHSR